MKSSVSDPGASRHLSALVKQRQEDSLACREGRSRSPTVLHVSTRIRQTGKGGDWKPKRAGVPGSGDKAEYSSGVN